MGPAADDELVLAAFAGTAAMAAVAGFVGVGGVGAVCAQATAMQEDKRIDEKKECFMVRSGSVGILMGVYQGGHEFDSSPMVGKRRALMHLYSMRL